MQKPPPNLQKYPLEALGFRFLLPHASSLGRVMSLLVVMPESEPRDLMFEDEWFRGLEISTEGGRGERKLPKG